MRKVKIVICFLILFLPLTFGCVLGQNLLSDGVKNKIVEDIIKTIDSGVKNINIQKKIRIFDLTGVIIGKNNKANEIIRAGENLCNLYSKFALDINSGEYRDLIIGCSDSKDNQVRIAVYFLPNNGGIDCVKSTFELIKEYKIKDNTLQSVDILDFNQLDEWSGFLDCSNGNFWKVPLPDQSPKLHK